MSPSEEPKEPFRGIPPSITPETLVVRSLGGANERWEDGAWVPGKPEDLRSLFTGGLRKLDPEELESLGITD